MLLMVLLRKLVTSVASSRPYSRWLPFRSAGCSVCRRHGQRLGAENHLFGKSSELRKLLLRACELHFEWRLALACQL